MALDGKTPSEMLRTLIARLSPEPNQKMIDRNLLVQYFSEAFYFSDGQAYPIFGWFQDGTGELKDANIDYLLSRRIEKTRPEWETK
jgi:hypothetical protein